MKSTEKIKVTDSNYPCGPCDLPLKCAMCGGIVTEENVLIKECYDECEICDYCSTRKCPNCEEHICCGGCV